MVLENVLYAVAALLIILWAIGYFVFDQGAIIHIMLVYAFIAIFAQLFSKDKIARFR